MTKSKHYFETEVKQRLTQIEKKAKIVLLHPHEGNENFTVHTKQDGKEPQVFSNVRRQSVIDALRRCGDLHTHAPMLFKTDLKSFLDHGYEILLFYKTLGGIAVEAVLSDSKSSSTPSKHRLVVNTDELCDVLDIDELGLESHSLCVSLEEFMKQKASDREKVVVDAYKQHNGDYLVHLTGESEEDDFTFASVPKANLAKVLKKKENDLKAELNADVFSAKGNEENELPHPATLKNLIDKGGKIVEAEKIKKRKNARSPAKHYKVKVQIGKVSKIYANMSEETLKGLIPIDSRYSRV